MSVIYIMLMVRMFLDSVPIYMVIKIPVISSPHHESLTKILSCSLETSVYLLLHNSPFFLSTNQHHQIQISIYCLIYMRSRKTPNNYIPTLKMATAMLKQIFKHSTKLSPKVENVLCSRRFILSRFMLPFQPCTTRSTVARQKTHRTS